VGFISPSYFATDKRPRDRNFKNIGGEGRDSNPRVVLPTTTNKPAAALANGDLSVILEPVQFLSRA